MFAIQNALINISIRRLKKAIIYSDSLSVVEAINTFYPKHPLVYEIQTLLHKLFNNNINVILCWTPSHVELKGNEDADKAAKEAINYPSLKKSVPVYDILSLIKCKVKQKWQSEWESFPITNKLRSIKTSISPWQSSIQKCRQFEVILTRLRIGHTNLSHGHLMSSPHNLPPICELCNSQMSVQHILVECNKYERQRCVFRCKNLIDILSETDHFSFYAILTFLKQTNLLTKI